MARSDVDLTKLDGLSARARLWIFQGTWDLGFLVAQRDWRLVRISSHGKIVLVIDRTFSMKETNETRPVRSV